MTRSSLLMAACALAASVASAQQKPAPKTPPAAAKQQPATKQPATKQPAPKTPATKAAPTKTGTTGQKAGTTKGGTTTPPKAAADTGGPPPTILREEYLYGSEGRRDPFNSLLTTNELRPTMSDLKITGIIFDPSGRRSAATLRDIVTNAMWRVTIGSTLGRMRVSAIRQKLVVFTIDEFGTTRQDSLVLGDTTKARVNR